MIRGATKVYNRFHDHTKTTRKSRLRELHSIVDRVVLDSYGWTDIPSACDYFLDYEIDEAAWGRRKKPYRYRWPDPVREEVLARLLASTRNALPRSPRWRRAFCGQERKKKYL